MSIATIRNTRLPNSIPCQGRLKNAVVCLVAPPGTWCNRSAGSRPTSLCIKIIVTQTQRSQKEILDQKLKSRAKSDSRTRFSPRPGMRPATKISQWLFGLRRPNLHSSCPLDRRYFEHRPDARRGFGSVAVTPPRSSPLILSNFRDISIFVWM